MSVVVRACAVVVALSLTACIGRRVVSPQPTPPAPIHENRDWPQGESGVFRNLSHPTISPFWGRAKSDGERYSLANLLGVLRLNWVPVVEELDQPLTAYSRVPKRTVCGAVTKAQLFVGAKPTTEFDWNFIVTPDDPVVVDTALLRRNADRIVQLNLDASWILENSGKYFTTEFWYRHGDAFQIEGEVTAPQSIRHGPASPFPCDGEGCGDGQGLRGMPLTAPDRLCIYGPWVAEALHGFRPEIHPVEAAYWDDSLGVTHLLVLQDASRRFDNGPQSNGKWWTVLGEAGGTQMEVLPEHWVQEALLGEFILPLQDSLAPRIEVVAQDGLEPIGSGGYPADRLLGDPVEVSGPGGEMVQATTLRDPSTGRTMLATRIQIRGAAASSPLSNAGSYVYLRLTR